MSSGSGVVVGARVRRGRGIRWSEGSGSSGAGGGGQTRVRRGVGGAGDVSFVEGFPLQSFDAATQANAEDLRDG